jgi:hypothetical protein
VTASVKERPQWPDKVGTVLVCVFVLVGVAAIILFIHQRYTSTGLYRTDYEGRVVDKSATVTESQEGSGTARRLLIKAADGQVFQVSVTRSLYERAQIGMWIKSKGSNVELTQDEPR